MENTVVRVDYAPGRLPAFWDRSVVFFANLLALFYGNEGATVELADRVGGIETYGGRLCPLVNRLFAGPDNLLVLESQPDGHLLRYFERDLGLTLPELAVLHHRHYETLAERLSNVLQVRGAAEANRVDGDFARQSDRTVARIADHTADWLDGFVTDAVLTRTAEILRKRTIISPDVSRRGNNKLLLHQFLQQRGFPVFDTVIVENSDEIKSAAAALRSLGYRRMVAKAQVGASGIGMRKFDTLDPDHTGLCEHMFFEGPCLVQGWLDEQCESVEIVGSPSMQLFLDETTVSIFDVTEQILSEDSVHEGNCSPPPYWDSLPGVEEAMRDQATAVGRWLHEGGYRGTASADYLVARRRGRLEVYVCEVNARVTGATYPSVLARSFSPRGSWLMRNLRFDPALSSSQLLGALRQAGYLFSGDSKEGLFPINFNLDGQGLVSKGQFLCIGADEHSCFEYLLAAADLLPVTWAYDRD